MSFIHIMQQTSMKYHDQLQVADWLAACFTYVLYVVSSQSYHRDEQPLR